MGAIKPYRETFCKHCNDGIIRKTIGGLCFEAPFHYQKNQQEKQRIKQSDKPKKQVKIKSISKNRLEALKRYRRLRDKYFEDHPVCEYPGCQSRDVDLHHKKPRQYYLCDMSIFMSVCREHHNWIHENDEKAREMGLLLGSI